MIIGKLADPSIRKAGLGSWRSDSSDHAALTPLPWEPALSLLAFILQPDPSLPSLLSLLPFISLSLFLVFINQDAPDLDLRPPFKWLMD